MLAHRLGSPAVTARQLEATMRRLGLVLILALLLQVRVDGRQLLLPLFAAAGAWWLRGLRPLVESAEAVRAWRAVVAAAVAVAVVSVVAWLPSQEPGRATAAAALLTLLGLTPYGILFERWTAAQGWAAEADLFRRAWRGLVADAVVLVVGLGLLVALGEPASSTHAGPFLPDVVLGRRFEGPAVVAGLVVFSLMWAGAALTLQVASRTTRERLRALADDVVPPA